MNSQKKQYRPAFSESQILYLYNLTSACPDLEGKKIHTYLTTFKAKIASGLKTPSYTANNKPSLEESLGFSSPEEKRNTEFSRLDTVWKQNKVILSDSEQYEYLAQRAMNDDSSLTEEEKELGKSLEIKLYGMTMGVFS